MVFIPVEVMFAGQWVSAVAGAAAAVLALALNCTLPGLTLFFYTCRRRLALCVNPLSQQRRHRNAQNMEGLSPVSRGRFSHNTCWSQKGGKGLTIGGLTLTLLCHCHRHGCVSKNIFPPLSVFFLTLIDLLFVICEVADVALCSVLDFT